MYSKFDTVVGRIIERNSHGCYVEMLDDKKSRGFFLGNGNEGDIVLCSVRKPDSYSYGLNLDSVLSYAPIANSSYFPKAA